MALKQNCPAVAHFNGFKKTITISKTTVSQHNRVAGLTVNPSLHA
jgi:hypothetical protein